MKKHILFITILLIQSLLFSGCDSKEQKIINEAVVTQATENSIAYIEEKYGFTPEISKAVLERIHGMFGSTPLSTVLVYMKYDDKEFHTYIDGIDKNTDGADDYQYDELKLELIDLSKQTVDNVKDVYIIGGAGREIYFDSIEDDCKQLFSTYYNGYNLSEVLGEYDNSIIYKYVSQDLSSFSTDTFDNLSGNSKTSFTMISYRSEEALSSCTGYATDIRRALYIDSYCSIVKGEASYKKYKLQQFDDFYYCVDSNELCEVSIKETTPHDISNWNVHKTETPSFSTKAYAISCNKNVPIYIFYPFEKIASFNKNDTIFAYYEKKGDDERYYSDSIDLASDYVGDFVVYRINPPPPSSDTDYYFTFIDAPR